MTSGVDVVVILFFIAVLQVHESDLRQLFGGLAIKGVRIGMDRETGQSRVSLVGWLVGCVGLWLERVVWQEGCGIS